MGRHFRLAVVVVLGIAVVVGVWAGSSQSQSVAAPQVPTPLPTTIPTVAPNHIDILPDPTGNTSGVYLPATLITHVGQRITWTNLDSGDHTATADNGAFNTNVLALRRSASWAPKRAGTYTYGDFLHPDMHGTIIVRP